MVLLLLCKLAVSWKNILLVSVTPSVLGEKRFRQIVISFTCNIYIEYELSAKRESVLFGS